MDPRNAATLGFTNPEMSVVDPTGGFLFKPGPPTAQVSLANVDPNLHMPYTEQWNFTMSSSENGMRPSRRPTSAIHGIGLIFYN